MATNGWQVRYERRWHFYPAWLPFAWRRVAYHVNGGDFVYGG